MSQDQGKINYPTVAEQAEIDRIASGLAQIWFAQGWIAQPQNPNYHEDYVIECAPLGELSGEKFSVQQKAHRNVGFSQGMASEVMATKHLLYYIEKMQVPMFLLVVDVTTCCGYYLFLQEWLDRETTIETLRQQESLTIKVPETNPINDGYRLLAEFRRAAAYMKKKFPGTVADAVAKDESELMAVDPRWDIKLNYLNAQKQYILNPKQDIEASLKLTGPNAEKFKAHFDFGKPVELDGNGVSLHGSPLFDKISAQGGFTFLSIQPAKPRIMEIHLWTEGADAFSLTLPGMVTGGEVGISLIAKLPGAPLTVELTIAREMVKQPRGEGLLSIGWDYSVWEGKPVTQLPYYEKLRRFAIAAACNQVIYQELLVDGNRVTGGTLGNPGSMEPFAYAAGVVNSMSKARALAEKLGITIFFPRLEQMTPQDFDWLDIAHELLTRGEYRAEGEGVGFGAVLNRTQSEPLQQLEVVEAVSATGYSIMRPDQKIMVFGVPISLGNLIYSVVPAKIVIREPGRSEFLAGRITSVPIQIAGIGSAVLRVSRAD